MGRKQCLLSEIVKFGNGKSRPKTEGIHPIYGGNGILGYTSETNYGGEIIVIGRVGAYCGATYYENRPIWISDNALAAIPKDNNNAKYLYYFLTNMALNQYAQGSSHPLVTQTLLKSIDIEISDDEHEQKTIAGVLSSLDDKIDLLHRQNKTLEAMAETLFQQWFVIEAKDDWEEISLFDAVVLVGGGTPKTSIPEYWNGNINWLSGGDIATNHKSIIISTEKSISEKGLNHSSTKILPKFSTVISARGTVGKYCILSKPMAFSQSNYGIQPKFSKCYFFTYLLIAHSVDELLSAAYGSVFDTITTNTFKGHLVLLPEIEIIENFENKVKPLFEKMLNNQTQIHTLEKLRNTLLPKLMSGEVSVEMELCNV